MKVKDKFGSYITKLMTTILDSKKEEFVRNLAINELQRLKKDIEEFILKNSIETDEEKTEKQLLQEDK
jgi:membrane-associated HD superfamily phosphohydrolase